MPLEMRFFGKVAILLSEGDHYNERTIDRCLSISSPKAILPLLKSYPALIVKEIHWRKPDPIFRKRFN